VLKRLVPVVTLAACILDGLARLQAAQRDVQRQAMARGFQKVSSL
jgi:hypothetical protein